MRVKNKNRNGLVNEPPCPIWPPGWIAPSAVPPREPTGEAAILATPASQDVQLVEPAALSLELETILDAIVAEARRLTSDPKLLGAVRNLLNDTRELHSDGNPDRALSHARYLSRSIPAYLTPMVKRL